MGVKNLDPPTVVPIQLCALYICMSVLSYHPKANKLLDPSLSNFTTYQVIFSSQSLVLIGKNCQSIKLSKWHSTYNNLSTLTSINYDRNSGITDIFE